MVTIENPASSESLFFKRPDFCSIIYKNENQEVVIFRSSAYNFISKMHK